MTEINPLPDCLSHLGQMMPAQKQFDLHWNCAIEQAAKVADGGGLQTLDCAIQIRRMKRPIDA